MTASPKPSPSRFAAQTLAFCAFSTSALAATPDCDTSGIQCRLNNILSLLYGVSVVLGVLLIVVIIVAVRSYLRLRKNRKLLP